METKHAIYTFKIKLQSLGALQPEAWTMILDLAQTTKLKANESFIRKEGTLAYITEGLLKEYDAQERKSPSIINFISYTEPLFTRKSNQNHYLKACLNTHIMFWNWEHLQLLYEKFPELKLVYNNLISQYDERMQLRMRLLELTISERITTFRNTFKPCLPYLKKVEIANYLHLNYTHFLKSWNSH